jgi:carbon-monoxide dehydrogenase medium subunit
VETLTEAAQAAQAIATPIDDMRGTKEFRRHVTGVLVRRVLEECVQRARHPA